MLSTGCYVQGITVLLYLLTTTMENFYFNYFGRDHWTGYVFAVHMSWQCYCTLRTANLVGCVLMFCPLVSLIGNLELLR